MTITEKLAAWFKDVGNPKSDVSLALVECVKALEDGTIHSVRETLALMAEGEGTDHKVYMQMSKHALTKLDEALEKLAEVLNEVQR